MKSFKLGLFFVSILFSSCEVKNVDNCILDVIWKIDKKSIDIINTDGDIFYKSAILKQLDIESKMEGEELDHLYIIVGKYGEVPDGKLIDLGLFYNIISTEIKTDKNLVIIKHGSIASPEIETVEIPVNLK